MKKIIILILFTLCVNLGISQDFLGRNIDEVRDRGYNFLQINDSLYLAISDYLQLKLYTENDIIITEQYQSLSMKDITTLKLFVDRHYFFIETKRGLSYYKHKTFDVNCIVVGNTYTFTYGLY